MKNLSALISYGKGMLVFGVALVCAAFFPQSVLAQTDLFDTGQTIASKLLTMVQTLVNIAFIAILACFFWGLVKFIWGGAEDKKVARNIMLWGVIALFVAASIWGIIFALRTTFGIGNESIGVTPGVV